MDILYCGVVNYNDRFLDDVSIGGIDLKFKVIRLPKGLGFIVKKILGIREH